MTRSTISVVKADILASSVLAVSTRGAGFTDITSDVAGFVADARGDEGVVHLHVKHTSASLTIQENADPDVLRDLMTALDGFAPRHAGYRHDSEGPDDMPAHIKTLLTDTSLTVPVLQGRMALGTWQAIYLIEHRAAPHRREIVIQFIGKARSPSA